MGTLRRARGHTRATTVGLLQETSVTGVHEVECPREREGAIVRLARGPYQVPDASIDANHTLAEAAKLVLKGVICLTSALAFHELTDQAWIAIGPKDDIWQDLQREFNSRGVMLPRYPSKC